MVDETLKLEWDSQKVYLMLGSQEIEMTRAEAEGLFVTLGNALQDQDEMRKENSNEGKSK